MEKRQKRRGRSAYTEEFRREAVVSFSVAPRAYPESRPAAKRRSTGLLSRLARSKRHPNATLTGSRRNRDPRGFSPELSGSRMAADVAALPVLARRRPFTA